MAPEQGRPVKPAPFDYHAPETVGEVAELLATLEDAKLLAGGQSLIPLLALRLARFRHLVDLGRVEELRGIDRTNGVVTIGAMTTDSDIETSEVVRDWVPLVAKATPLIGHFQIRNRGTLGGSMAHADPAAEYPAVAAALDATMVLSSASGSRRLPAADFFEGTFTTAIAEDEILTAVEFPIWPGASGFGAYEVARRHGDFAIVGAMAGVQVDGSRVMKATLGLFAVAGTPHRASEAEAALIGSSIDSVDLAEVGRLAASDLDPPNDVHASASYRRRIAGVVVERALGAAFEEAMGRS
jgi:carbon-monoxide dehydrogenase medium subunit